ncbi:MAG: hypothetical protein ACLP5H_28125 [Desulfomonilaceae bacterium]
MGVVAYTLLHILSHFCLIGEQIKCSVEWLIKRPIKVEARPSYHARRCNFTWLLPYPWPDTTNVCWPEGCPEHFELTEGRAVWYAQENKNTGFFTNVTTVFHV